MPDPSTIIIATRGSALALAQARRVLALCENAFPETAFELRTVKTSGDRLQGESSSRDRRDPNLKALFTKEIEEALLNKEADLAVHSLKDLPTEIPPGLHLGAIPERLDARDVLVYRRPGAFGKEYQAFPPHTTLTELPIRARIATGSVRRKGQLLALRPDLEVGPIRGNVGTRLQKLAENPNIDATLLSAAGLQRMNWSINPDGRLSGETIPQGLMAVWVGPDEILPCVGQGAIAIEARDRDERTEPISQRLDVRSIRQCVTAERAFLRAMGGDCQSPMAALGQWSDQQILLRALVVAEGKIRRTEVYGDPDDPARLGEQAAEALRTQPEP